MFELNDNYLVIETGLSEKQITEAKKRLEGKQRVFFYNNWVFIPRAEKFNRYSKGEKTGVAFKKRLKEIPVEIRKYFLNLLHTYKLDTLSIPYRYYSDRHRNKKPEIRNPNKKEEIRKRIRKRKEEKQGKTKAEDLIKAFKKYEKGKPR